MSEVKYYLIIVWGDVEPELRECASIDDRYKMARQHKLEHGDHDGLYRLDIENGVPTVSGFEACVLDEMEESPIKIERKICPYCKKHKVESFLVSCYNSSSMPNVDHYSCLTCDHDFTPELEIIPEDED